MRLVSLFLQLFSSCLLACNLSYSWLGHKPTSFLPFFRTCLCLQVKDSKFWPTVGRVDNVYGDRNLVCTCPPLTDYQ